MKRRLVIALGIASLSVLAVVLVVRLKGTNSSYQGHSVKFWVRELATPDQRRRDDAIAAFGALRSNAVPTLAKLLQQHDSALRQEAWAAAPKLPARLGNFLRRQAGPLDAAAVRTGAARALALLGPLAQGAVPALAQALHDPEMQVRYEAGQALGHIGKPGVPALAEALSDTNDHVRYCAVSGLGCCIDPEAAQLAVPPLFKALGEKTSGTVASWANIILGRLGTNAAPFLTNVMANPDPVLRERAARALGNVRHRAWVVPPLVQMLHDPEAACRAAAAQTLVLCGLPNLAMTEAFLEALKDPEPAVRTAAVHGLANALGQRARILPALTACLSDQSPAVREAAARALGRFGAQAQPASGELTRLLEDKNAGVSEAAREALSKLEATPPSR